MLSTLMKISGLSLYHFQSKLPICGGRIKTMTIGKYKPYTKYELSNPK